MWNVRLKVGEEIEKSILLNILFVMALGMSSCVGSKSGEKKNTAAANIAVAGFAAGTHFTGGAVIWMNGPDGLRGLTLADENEIVFVDLPPGQYTFNAIGWLGGTPLAGTPKCGVTELNLLSGNNNVEINLSAGGCTDAAFGPANYLAGSNFKPLRLISCNSNAGQTAGADCNGPTTKGEVQSYRIAFNEFGLGVQTITDLKSNCIDGGTGTNSIADTTYTIPVGSGAPEFVALLRVIVVPLI